MIPDFRKYAYGWIVLFLWVLSAATHYVFGMFGFLHEHGSLEGYHVEWIRDASENYASEFFQLLVQVVGLAWFLQVGSPASRESGQRMEAKLDSVLSRFPGGLDTIRLLDKKYMRQAEWPKAAAGEDQ